MTEATPAEILRDWFELVWNQNRLDLVETYLSHEAIAHGLDEAGADGVAHDIFPRFHGRLKAALPDVQFTLLDVVETRDTAAARWSATATHTGDGFGMPPTGKAVTIGGMTFVRVAGGKVVESWNQWDRLSLALTIGRIVPVQPSA